MASLEKNIITVKDLLSTDDLQIPSYQRPYKWTAKNVNQLIDDILLHKEKSAYRLGTLVIHKEKEIFNIVDGQQRSLTLTLIAYAIIENRTDILQKINPKEDIINYIPKLLNLSFTNDISKFNIQNNYKEIKRRIREFDKESIFFFFFKCELVQIILSDISEAFQFFDSQNSRGKDLEPHDLLKAFHLREMAHLSTEEKQKSVLNWELMETGELSNLFSLYLYRIRNWSKGYPARYFTKDEVDVFKGISPNIQEDYPFAQSFRIVHHYTDNYKNSYHRNIDKNEFEYPFQIDQTIINGKRFFEMIAHYKKVIDNVKSNQLKIFEKKDGKDYSVLEVLENYAGRYRTGDKYIRVLFDCGIIYFLDKFGEKDISKAIDKIFIWAYTLRLQMQAVQIASIDNYALTNKKIFKKIREATRPNDIVNLKLETLNKNRSTKTNEIVELFEKMNYYDGK
ncbi:hypothetical protein EZS27_028269 [termite gut metagenome]|uniref:Uncharacterized protein n=1 Tax=termite gut metagenome TaxID=433724 RepID=A0A5J4QJW2_9ZZZZ